MRIIKLQTTIKVKDFFLSIFYFYSTLSWLLLLYSAAFNKRRFIFYYYYFFFLSFVALKYNKSFSDNIWCLWKKKNIWKLFQHKTTRKRSKVLQCKTETIRGRTVTPFLMDAKNTKKKNNFLYSDFGFYFFALLFFFLYIKFRLLLYFFILFRIWL